MSLWWPLPSSLLLCAGAADWGWRTPTDSISSSKRPAMLWVGSRTTLHILSMTRSIIYWLIPTWCNNECHRKSFQTINLVNFSLWESTCQAIVLSYWLIFYYYLRLHKRNKVKVKVISHCVDFYSDSDGRMLSLSHILKYHCSAFLRSSEQQRNKI